MSTDRPEKSWRLYSGIIKCMIIIDTSRDKKRVQYFIAYDEKINEVHINPVRRSTENKNKFRKM